LKQSANNVINFNLLENEMSEQETSLAVVAEQQTEMAQASAPKSRFSTEMVEASSLDTVQNLPDLTTYKRHFMSLETEYWSPEPGEEKMVYVMGVGMTDIKDQATGVLKPTECVMLAEPQGDKIKRYIVAGVILVSNVKDAIRAGVIVPNTSLTPVSILYIGQIKNKNNAFKSNRWEITPLVQG
jgi:hypothetical protein